MVRRGIRWREDRGHPGRGGTEGGRGRRDEASSSRWSRGGPSQLRSLERNVGLHSRATNSNETLLHVNGQDFDPSILLALPHYGLAGGRRFARLLFGNFQQSARIPQDTGDAGQNDLEGWGRGDDGWWCLGRGGIFQPKCVASADRAVRIGTAFGPYPLNG